MELGRIPRALVWVVALALISAGMFYVTRHNTVETMEPLLGGREFSVSELSQIEIAFAAEGLDQYRRSDSRVFIPRENRQAYLKAIQGSAAMPNAFQTSIERALEQASIFESESRLEFRRRNAKSRDLGNRIAAFDDIAWATVEYDKQNMGGFSDSVTQSACVIIGPKSGKPVSPNRIQQIQDLVSAAYAGMKPEQVNVTDVCSDKPTLGSDDPLVRQREQAEYELEHRISKLLGQFQGLQIAVSSIDGKDGSDAGLARRVAVWIPDSEVHRQWIRMYKQSNPDHHPVPRPTEQELATAKSKVSKSIQSAIMPFVEANGYDTEELIRISNFPDGAVPSYESAQTKEAMSIQTVVAWSRQHPAVALSFACLLIISMGFCGSAIRMRLRHPPSMLPETGPNSNVEQSFMQGDSEISKSPIADEQITLREDLAELVESNPELAAQIVHSWLADAA